MHEAGYDPPISRSEKREKQQVYHSDKKACELPFDFRKRCVFKSLNFRLNGIRILALIIDKLLFLASMFFKTFIIFLLFLFYSFINCE